MIVNSPRFDLVVVGAGIVGLAHAYQAARAGRKVLVCERSPRAMGASVRNFGMIWPSGQAQGFVQEIALRSRDHWLQVAKGAGLWHNPCGSLHLAYADDEMQVLEEFVQFGASQLDVRLLSRDEIAARYGAVKLDGLRGGLFSSEDVCVDPRQSISEIPAYLQREFGVEFRFNTAVIGWDAGVAKTSRGDVSASHLLVCGGDDFQTLFPETFDSSGLIRCKLQMMRSQPQGADSQLDVMLAGGLTLGHYASFEACPSLPALKQRFARDLPDYKRWGIHVMASQHGTGEITIGDSHEYFNLDSPVPPFDRDEVDSLILDYLNTFLNVPDLKIAQRWQGVYAKHPEKTFFVAHPAEGATVVGGVGGAGMTLSFGLAEKIIKELN
ncbi:TIGR03364 family FAD-dependent oxidoreductase [bacterium]|nr:MAG: TIGR03364 family FAD-dependent oxidoreductase [bacterium]